MKHNPYSIAVGMKLRIRNTDTATFVYHKGYATSPTLQYCTFVQHIGYYQILWFGIVATQQFLNGNIRRKCSAVFNLHAVIIDSNPD